MRRSWAIQPARMTDPLRRCRDEKVGAADAGERRRLGRRPERRLDWVVGSLGDDATAWTVDHLWQAGVHIMGGRTYHDMAAHWPTRPSPSPPR
jgi:hypothetical protein